MSQYWVHQYTLKAAGALNAKSSRSEYSGFLVRDEAGFGCLHPWPELGDPTLKDCLEDLGGPGRFSLVQKTRACLAADGVARQQGVSLFDGLRVPDSHATLPRLTRKFLTQAVVAGFETVKVKVGRDCREELNLVRELIHESPNLKWRLDFNGSAEEGVLYRLFEKWRLDERARVDFIEDPFLYDSEVWRLFTQATGIPLANDRECEKDDGATAFLVKKPAIDKLSRQRQRVIVTSYLDHPVGQVFAAYEAGVHRVTEVCGLQTHGCFLPSSFSESLGEVVPKFGLPEGMGLGFDDLLEGLPWKPLKTYLSAR